MKRTPLVSPSSPSPPSLAATWYLLQRPRPRWVATEAVVQKPSAEPGVLRFPTAAPQLAQLKVERARARPGADGRTLAARVSYDEKRHRPAVRPIAGRAVEIRANLGDSVKAGDVLAVLDAPSWHRRRRPGQGPADAQLKKTALDR